MKDLLILIAMLIACPLFVAADTPASAPADAEAEYLRAIDKRGSDAVKVLNLTDSMKAANVQMLIVAHYKALRDWHDANDPKLKDKTATTQQKETINQTLKAMHDDFTGKLAGELTSEQVTAVKDK